MLAQHAEREHVLAAPRVAHELAALALHRDLAHVEAGGDELVVHAARRPWRSPGRGRSRHMFSSRMVQPGFSSPARTRPSSTCSLKATTRSVSLPPLVTGAAPMRMRLPEAPAVLRAGGRISAGMISTVHTPLPDARGDGAERTGRSVARPRRNR